MTLIKSLFLLVNMAVSIRHRRAGEKEEANVNVLIIIITIIISNITHGL